MQCLDGVPERPVLLRGDGGGLGESGMGEEVWEEGKL